MSGDEIAGLRGPQGSSHEYYLSNFVDKEEYEKDKAGFREYVKEVEDELRALHDDHIVRLKRDLTAAQKDVTILRGLEWERFEYTKRMRSVFGYLALGCIGALVATGFFDGFEELRPYLTMLLMTSLAVWLTA